jgi:hypothetical protein
MGQVAAAYTRPCRSTAPGKKRAFGNFVRSKGGGAAGGAKGAARGTPREYLPVSQSDDDAWSAAAASTGNGAFG